MAPRVLMLYIEPTPYVLGFVRCAVEHHGARVESLFIDANVSQPWNLALDVTGAAFLPKGRLRAAVTIGRLVASGRYDVLHLAGWGHPLLVWALLVGWAFRIPIFLESDTQLPVRAPWWRATLKRALYPFLFRIPLTVMPAGRRQADYFRFYGVTDERIITAQMTVDVAGIVRRTDAMCLDGTDAAARVEWGIAKDAIVFVFVGRLEDPRKGIGTLLESFAHVSHQRDDVVLLIGGDGSARPQVEAAAALNPRIRYVGRLEWEAVVRALCCADVAVVPSLIEPFGLVVNEAMAAGLPVIVSDRVGCVDDLVQHEKTGLVFRAGDAVQLAAMMIQLVDDAGQRRRMGATGRQVIAGWTLEDQARIASQAWSRAHESHEQTHLAGL